LARERILKDFINETEGLAGARLTLLRDGPIELYRAQFVDSSVIAAIPVAPVSETSLEQLRYEYSIRDKFDGGFALRPLRFTVHNQNPALLLHDSGGEMLKDLISGATPPEIFIRHALLVASSLASVHDAGLVHGGLTPSNIMVHPGELRARLTGFRALALMPTLSAFAGGTEREMDREALHYMAPEATGRVNRVFDERSDLYSLGCIFFHMLTGRVLFPGVSPSELIHAHIARRPDEDVLLDLKRSFNARLVELVCRLLAKEPSERYQRASDVVDDLVALTTVNHPRTATLGQRRRSGAGLFRSGRLVGRLAELERLRDAIQSTPDDQKRRLWLVEGPAGIGKTALVNRLGLEVGGKTCEFAQGKCELGDGVTPYASLSRALHALLRAALGYPPLQYAQLQRRLREAFADESSIITTIFPDFSRLLGEHTHHPAVSAHAERHRFLDAIAKLLRAFASKERPLLLFLDDLPWVDEATLEVVEYVLQNPLCGHVLLVGAMRDGKVESEGAHVRPFVLTDMVERMTLGPLSGREVGGLLRAVLDEDDVGNLTVLEGAIYRGGGGNPLHTIQLVRSLIDDEVMVYDEGNGEWVASLPALEARSDLSSVVELLSTRVGSLAQDALMATQYLAILAEPSSLEILSTAMCRPQNLVELSLREALEKQFIVLSDGLYSFTHDRVRDAVYETFGDLERQEKHLEVGSNLWENVVKNGLKVSVFVVANHLTRARLPVSDHRRRQFALIILDAANKAREATAYEAAIAYLANARDLLKDRADLDGDLLAVIELRLGECEFVCMRTIEASERIAAISKDLLDSRHRAELIRLRLAMYVTLDQPDKGLEVGFRYLEEEAGIVFSKDNRLEGVEADYRRLLEHYGSRSVQDLVNLQLMVDERVRNAMYVMTDLIPAVMFSSQDLAELIILRMINLSLEYGHCDASCYAYVCLSFIAGARFEDYATTAVFGELAMRLPAERGLNLYAGRVQMCFGALSLPWTGFATEARRHLEEATALTDRQGDMTFAVYSRRHIVTNLLFSGGALSEAQQIAEDGLKLARDAAFALVVDAFMAQAWLIRELRGVPVDIGMHDPNVEYLDLLSDCISGKFHRDIAAFAFWTYRLQVAVLWGDLPKAMEAEARASASVWASPAFLENADFVFYSGLLRIAMARTAAPADREAHTRLVRDRVRQMQCWAEACPENFLSREKLLAAELSELMEDKANSLALYEEAIALADQSRDMHIQSVARELASRFAARCGLRSAQQGYLEQARSAYACWGADAKVRHLDAEFPALRAGRSTEFRELGNSLLWSEDRFETEVVLRSVRALSGEFSLQQVMKIILQNALQYAGAERAVLCLLEDGVLYVAARAKLAQGQLEMNLVRTVLSPELIATPIAYLTLRSKESVVLEDARDDPQYGLDSYVRAHRSRSIMCVPLLKQGSLTGLLYLENALIAGVFNATRVRTLEVLASQVAFSLENAKLYENVEAEHIRRAEADRYARETQEKLARAARLTELGELAAFIVHEVSQPISTVSTCARAAIRWLNREIPDLSEAVAALEMISASSERATNIIGSIRAMVKESRPNKSSMDIHEAILEVFNVLRERIDAEKVMLSSTFATDALIVSGDRILLQQVVMNLLTNALEAMSDMEEREKCIAVQTHIDEHHMVWVSVSDTGRGISDEIAAHIFDSLATTKGYGMGMGLSICKSIVEAHDGKIEVCSAGAAGASFRFSVPIWCNFK